MCYSDDARPPLPPIGGAAADQGEMNLTAKDGTQFMAYFARASKPTGAGMVVMPDVRGLHHFYKELAQRFAEAGIDAVAIDYFGRTAGSTDRSESFEFMPHVEKTTQESIAADVSAAIAYLKTKDGGAVKSVFTVGFCFGGSSSWNQSACSSRAPMPPRQWRCSTPSTQSSPRRTCRTRCTSTTQRLTASSTARSRSGRTRRPTPGARSWLLSRSTAEAGLLRTHWKPAGPGVFWPSRHNPQGGWFWGRVA